MKREDSDSDFFKFESDEDIFGNKPTNKAGSPGKGKKQNRVRHESTSSDESDSDTFDSFGSDDSESEGSHTSMVDIDVAQQRILEKQVSEERHQ